MALRHRGAAGAPQVGGRTAAPAGPGRVGGSGRSRGVVRRPGRVRVPARRHPQAVSVLGPAGTVVDISGTAGKGCVVDKNWFGFDFERYGQTNEGPFIEMTAPQAATGSSSGAWSAIFEVPSYLGGSSTRGPGALVVPGHYQVFAPTCEKGKAATASFTVTATTSGSRHQLRGHGRDARWPGVLAGAGGRRRERLRGRPLVRVAAGREGDAERPHRRHRPHLRRQGPVVGRPRRARVRPR